MFKLLEMCSINKNLNGQKENNILKLNEKKKDVFLDSFSVDYIKISNYI